MIELLIVLILAAVGLLVISRAFSTTSTGTEKTQKAATKAAKKEKAAASVPKEKLIAADSDLFTAEAAPKKSNSVPKKRGLTKKQKAAKAAEEAEMDRIIAASAQSTTGMATDKSKVISLESIKKQDTVAAKKTQEVEVSTKQRLIEAEEGFAIVEKKKERSAPSQKHIKAKNKKAKEAEQDRSLSNFFKKQDGKGKNGGYKRFDEKDDDAKPTGGNVTMRKKITSDAKDMWNERKYE